MILQPSHLAAHLHDPLQADMKQYIKPWRPWDDKKHMTVMQDEWKQKHDKNDTLKKLEPW